MIFPTAACKGINDHSIIVMLHSCGFSGKDDFFSFYKLSSTINVSQSTTLNINCAITGAVLVMCMEAVMVVAQQQSASSTII